MVEDNDKVGKHTVLVRTDYSFAYGEASVLTITAPASQGITPKTRTYTVHFAAFTAPESVEVNGKSMGYTYDESRREIVCEGFTVNEGETVTVTVKGDGKLPENEITDALDTVLKRAQTATASSEMLKRLVAKKQTPAVLISDLLTRDVHEDLKGALIELVSAK